MTDIIDQAQAQEALNIEQSLQLHAALARSNARPKATGHCLNHECEEPFEHGSARLFCGPACAERYDAIKRLKTQ